MSAKSGAAILNALREKMTASSVNALIIPSSDAHNSEYVAPCLQRRAFVSHFHGSAGTVVVTQQEALLWTDGRYWLAAAEELYPEFQLMKQGKPETPTMEDWIIKSLGANAVVGIDPFVCTIGEWERLSEKLSLKPVEDFVGPMMDAEPSPAALKVRPAEFCGQTTAERRAAILATMKEHQCDVHVLSALDEIAWLTNLRGDDVPYNPVFYSYAIIDEQHPKVRIYINLEKVTDAAREATASILEFLPYQQFAADLAAIVAGRHVLVDQLQTSEALSQIFAKANAKVTKVLCGPAQKIKGIKTPVELQGFRDCHVRDGAALTRYLAWLHDQIAVKEVTDLNEFDAATRLAQFRAENERFVQLSFESISSTGPNGAQCHYSAPAVGSAMIRKDALYLVDSGAQYLDGTTDTTRTITFGNPTEEEKEMYTLVLKGHVSFHNTVFPKGLMGERLDTIARHALWQVGLDYAHGTGHGVGSFLNVHEGPHGVGIRATRTNVGLEAGCVVTNEPGFYKDGHFGIRIENQEEVIAVPTKYSKDGFLGLSAFTRAPLCRDLIVPELLTESERKYVNDYSAQVLKDLEPLLEAKSDDLALKYLKHHTQSI